MKTRLFWLALSIALAATGCGSKGSKLPEGAAATVDGQTITVPEVEKVAQNFLRQNVPPDSTAQGATPSEQIYNTALARLVEQKLLEKAAEKAGITVTDEQVQGRVAQLKAQVGGQEAFVDLLAKNNVTEADVVRDMRTNMLLGEYFTKTMEQNPAVSDDEISDYFDGHPESFGPQPEVHASHILLMVPPGSDDAAKAAVKAKAEGILAKIQGGADFAQMAKDNSEDTGSGANGGDLSWFGHGAMVAPFDSAAFALEPGQVSGLVETQFGYHIIKALERRTSEGRKIEDVKEGIRSFLSQEKGQKQFRARVDSLKAAAKIQIGPAPADVITRLGS
jgi:peptidyl-prolyl cis-trans isomerase C